MAEISISNSDWDRLKLKVKRKYNHLTEGDLAYQEGQEEELISRLMNRIKRTREYVVFTLRKGLVHIDTNRL
ncbi:MAG: CsbD family protein [Daejeonella sp.]